MQPINIRLIYEARVQDTAVGVADWGFEFQSSRKQNILNGFSEAHYVSDEHLTVG